MSRTYKATGINLKSMPLGETDRVLTVLTREFGLIRAIAPGCRKHHSKLGGRSELFVVNELLIAKGRSLDKITQAETLETYPKLGQDLLKLTASQYLAELVLSHALSEHPQEELFCLLTEHLRRLEQLPKTTQNKSLLLLAHLAHAVFHTLALAGIAPQVHLCCITGQLLAPDLHDPDWRIGFSAGAGGAISLPALARLQAEGRQLPKRYPKRRGVGTQGQGGPGAEGEFSHPNSQLPTPNSQLPTAVMEQQEIPKLDIKLSATELSLLQQLANPNLPQISENSGVNSVQQSRWLSIERILRQYSQYHLGRQIRSAVLMDTYFASLSTSS